MAPYYDMVELSLAAGDSMTAFAYAERAKGRVLLDVLRSGRANINKTMTADEREQEKRLNVELVSLNAQIMADPALRNIQLEEARSASLQQVISGLEVSAAALPAPVQRERALMAGHIIIQTCADFERGLADAVPARGKTWRKVGSGLVDALVGLWSAPVSQ